VSCTGHGEYFIRCAAAHHITAAVEFGGLPLQQAAQQLLEQNVAKLGGYGGVIAIDAHGHVVMQFTTSGMFRGARDSNGMRVLGITR